MSIRIRPNWDQSYHLILLDVISDAYTTTLNYVWANNVFWPSFFGRRLFLSQFQTLSWCYAVGCGRSLAIFPRSWCYAVEVLLQFLTRSWCYAVEVLLHFLTRSWCYAVDVLLQFSTRSWCYAVDILLHFFKHALDATLWTFSCIFSTRSWCYAGEVLWLLQF